MMNTRFYNAKIFTSDEAQRLVEGELHVAGDVITHVGPVDKSFGPLPAFDREIDCRGNLLMPGFKNAHTHTAMTFLRSKADDLPLQSWLYDCVFPKEHQLQGDDVLWLTKLGILEYLSGGTTAMFDMYMFRPLIAQAAIDMGFRTVLVNAANDFGGTPEEEMAEAEHYGKLHPLISFQYGLHAEYTCSKKLLDAFSEMIRSVKRPLYAHLSETQREVDECVARYGKRPFELFEELGFFDYGGGGYHCVHVNEREMEIIKRHGVYVITCPGSNLKLGSGIAPVQAYLERGIPVAIGTDGPASNNCLDMFREMFLVTGLQKITHGADAVDGMQVIQMACSTGARAMGLTDCDALAPGKQADVIMIDLHMPNMQPENNLVKNVVFSGSKQNVKLTMIAGRILYENGVYQIADDPERIYFEANRIIGRMQ